MEKLLLIKNERPFDSKGRAVLRLVSATHESESFEAVHSFSQATAHSWND
jgi:hypothetical protein